MGSLRRESSARGLFRASLTSLIIAGPPDDLAFQFPLFNPQVRNSFSRMRVPKEQRRKAWLYALCVKRRTGEIGARKMSPAEVVACYRLYAATCIEIASDLEPKRKLALLTIAQAWMALADFADRNTEAGLVLGTSLAVLSRPNDPFQAT
jgi:hypothetical protein